MYILLSKKKKEKKQYENIRNKELDKRYCSIIFVLTFVLIYQLPVMLITIESTGVEQTKISSSISINDNQSKLILW